MSKFKEFMERKGVKVSAKRYFVDAMGAMAMGLFASLLISTIFSKIAELTNFAWLTQTATYASQVTGPAMACAIGMALGAPNLVMFSLCAVGMASNALGGPLCTLFCAIFACEAGKIVSKETRVDILVTPTVVILSGVALATLIGPGVSQIMAWLGDVIKSATELQPFFMGIAVSVIVGICLTLPISSAAICATLTLTGLAGGAATAGCCAQMVGFAVMSFSENRWGGLAAQGLGTSMLQMGNIVKRPVIWLPPTICAAITGPIATCVFALENGSAVASGMGTCGLVGPIGLMAAECFGSAWQWVGLIAVCFVLPAVLTPIIALPFRKAGLIRQGDLKLDL